MLRKIPKNDGAAVAHASVHRAWAIGLLLCLLALTAFAPRQAYAYIFTQPVVIDPATGDICPGAGLTRRLVPCIESTLLYATNKMLSGISALMADTVTIACTLALAIWGIQLFSGRRDVPVRGGLMLAIKIGVVLTFSANFGASLFDPSNTQGGFFGIMLDSMDYMLGQISSIALSVGNFANNATCINNPQTIWDNVDCMLEILIGGIFSPDFLLDGLTGFFVASMLSGITGFFGASQLAGVFGLLIAIMGFYLIIQLLAALARGAAIVIGGYFGFAIIAMISPFWVPTLLFDATKSYFDKAVRIGASFLIQPMIVIAYLALLTLVFDTVVYSGPNSMFRALAGNAVGGDQIDPNFQIGSWMLGNGGGAPPCEQDHWIYCTTTLGAKAVQIDPKRVRAVLGVPGSVNGGELGQVGQLTVPPTAWTNIFRSLGIGQDIDPDTGLPNTRFVRVGTPVTTVDWANLALLNNYVQADGTADVTGYLVNLLLSALMAMIAVYVFKNLLNSLPFISAAITQGFSLDNAAIRGVSDKLSFAWGK